MPMTKNFIAIAAVLVGFGLSTLSTPTKAETQSEPTESVTTNINIKLFTFSFTFEEVGSYPYYCKRHDFMRGEIKVVPAP